MNIHELSTFNLNDAIKFHDRLNPRLWDANEQLKPEVKEKLLEIAADFQEFLGINDLEVEDITISGSNAAYSYTPHSDIDLHLVVKKPELHNEVYQELFNAKKYQYNDQHNIRVRGADVELYVQPADEPHVSLGIYSVLNDKWIQVPRRKRAKVEHNEVKLKYEDLKARIENAIASDDIDRMNAVAKKIKEMRQAGLDAHGEFGPENLAFKMLRTQGEIKRLYDARNAAKDQALSLKEREKQKQRVRYGFGEASTPDGVSPTTCMFLNEQDDESILQSFINSTAKKLGIKRMPKLVFHRDDGWSTSEHSFGMYQPESHTLHVSLDNRHILDILRTTAHELAHCRQHEIEPLPVDAGNTGSKFENEAHAVAGIIMRDFADEHPEYFDMESVDDSEAIDEGLKGRAAAAALAACIASGCATNMSGGKIAASAADVARTVNTARKINSTTVQSEIQQEIVNLFRALGGDANAKNISRVYSLLKEASGYIPTKAQASDPRFKMALTKDIHPGQTGKEANKMSLKTNAQGKPSLIYKSANQLSESAITPVQAFIKQIYSEYPVSPFNPNQRGIVSGEGENQTIALFELEPSKSVKDAVELHWIQAYPQRQGVGTAAIRELQVKARKAGLKMSLYPKPNGSVSQASLKRLYKRLGFNPIHKGAATMVWDPELNESYKEVEFVCVNSEFSDATAAEKQTSLKRELEKIPGIVVLHQDWSDGDAQQLSMAAIITDRANTRTITNKIKQVAEQHGVEIDLINDVDDSYVDRAIRGEHTGQILTELADSPYNLQFSQHGANKSRYGFETDSGAEYMIDVYPASSPGAFQNNLLSVGFALLKDGEEVDSATGTAGADSLRIFGTVLAATKDALDYRTKQGLDIEYIQFAAKHAEPSRVSLYQRFAKNIGRYLPGWEFVGVTKNDEYVRFTVKRSDSKKDLDEDSNKLTVYHGNQGGISRGFVTPMWWTESYEDAAYYATINDSDGFVYTATLLCNKPYTVKPNEETNNVVSKWRELAEQGYDCINDPEVGDWIPFYAEDIHLVSETPLDPTEQELSEDWRNWVSGLGAASMIAGGGSAAYDAYKQQQAPQTQPAQVQQVQAPKAKVQAPVAAPTTQQTISHAQDLLATKGAQILQKAAKAAGLKGSELAQFMAQCAHETANFTTLEEFGDRNYFKKYDIKFNPAKAKELGNVRPGDGERYKGRGFIQLTGRDNYKRAGQALGLPLEQRPELVERPDVAAKVALWFWQNRVQPKVDNFSNTTQATKPINPGLKGLQDRHNKFTGMKVAMAKPATLTKTAAQAPAAKIAAKPAAAKTKVAAKPQKVKKV